MAAVVPALTTTFTPSPYCTNEYWRVNETGTYSQDGQIQTYQYMTLGPPSTSDCFPTGYNEANGMYYSPGVCPEGYTEACSSTIAIRTLTETHATCCPSSYVCQTNTINSWGWYLTKVCTARTRFPALLTTAIHTVSSGSTFSFTSSVDGALNANGISIRYQLADFITTSSSSSSSATSNPTSPQTAAATTTQTSSSSTGVPTQFANSLPSGSATNAVGSAVLSGGAIAGIVIGGIAIIAIIAAALFLARRSGKPRAPAHELSAPMYAEIKSNSLVNQQYAGAQQYVAVPPQELPGAAVHEMPGDGVRGKVVYR